MRRRGCWTPDHFPYFMPTLDAVPTPCLVIEQRRLTANLERMQARAAGEGAQLRPHTKTHKMVALARRQLALGARGVTVAKVDEAEVFVQAGVEDVRVAYTVVGRDKFEKMASLSARARLSYCVDSMEAARQASACFAARGVSLDVLLEIDAGFHRCGIAWDSRHLVTFARAVAALSGLRLAGVLTHEGHAYGPPKAGEEQQQALRRVMAETAERMLRVAARLGEAGVSGATSGRFEISIGSTPSMSVFENRERQGWRITEVRPGNYVFHDMTQVDLGVCSLQACALSVLTTVVSKHRSAMGTERFFLDAGRKVFTSDTAPSSPGYGRILYNPAVMVPHPHARLVALSEEHGWAQVPGGATFEVGDRVRVVPNHACVAVNTQDEAFLVDGDEVVDTWRVDARGRVR